MNNMISNRLKSLVKYVDKKDNVIDIGCDHALLDIYLVLNNNIDNALVSDISKNALNQGIENIKKYNLENSISTRCGSGLEVLNDKDIIDTIIISGMGTNTILEILNNKYLNKINKMIIQSNKDYELLRRKIVKLGFKISNEECIVDNDKVYINIIFVRGKEEYSDVEYKYGLNTMLNKELYYNHLINRNNSIVNKLNNSIKKNELLEEIEFIKINLL